MRGSQVNEKWPSFLLILVPSPAMLGSSKSVCISSESPHDSICSALGRSRGFASFKVEVAEESHCVFLRRNRLFHQTESSWLNPELGKPQRNRHAKIAIFDSLLREDKNTVENPMDCKVMKSCYTSSFEAFRTLSWKSHENLSLNAGYKSLLISVLSRAIRNQ